MRISKRFKKSLQMAAFGLFVVMLLMVTACSPKIVKFTPGMGPEGTSVTITGSNFEGTPAENIVKFAGTTATDVTVPETNKIVAKVPAGAKTGLISVSTSCGTGYSKQNFIVPGDEKWTFMVYLDGDNNLEGAGLDDFMEMSSVGSSNEVNIVVQMDRIAGHSSLYGNWTDTRRFLIQKDDDPSMAPVQNIGEANMGDPAVLQDFVEWGITNYPAEHYALVIWNHGDGWRTLKEKIMEKIKSAGERGESDWGVMKAVASDDTDNDILYMKEVQTALESAKQGLEERLSLGIKLDVVGFDACLMGMVEVAYAIRNTANCMVGSEQTEPFDGWPYDTILQSLVNVPAYSPQDLSGIIVTEYVNSYAGSSNITQSAIDMNNLNNLVTKINNFTDKANTEWANLKTARTNTLQYHPSWVSCWGVDLWDFANETLKVVTSQDIKDAATELKNAITNCVINEGHSANMADSHGIAIYFPPSQAQFDNDPDHTGYEEANVFMPVDFVKNTNWDNWLQDFYANIP